MEKTILQQGHMYSMILDSDFYLINDHQITTKEQWLVMVFSVEQHLQKLPKETNMMCGFQNSSLSGSKEVHSLVVQKLWQILETSRRGKSTKNHGYIMQILLDKVFGSWFPTLRIEEWQGL